MELLLGDREHLEQRGEAGRLLAEELHLRALGVRHFVGDLELLEVVEVRVAERAVLRDGPEAPVVDLCAQALRERLARRNRP